MFNPDFGFASCKGLCNNNQLDYKQLWLSTDKLSVLLPNCKLSIFRASIKKFQQINIQSFSFHELSQIQKFPFLIRLR